MCKPRCYLGRERFGFASGFPPDYLLVLWVVVQLLVNIRILPDVSSLATDPSPLVNWLGPISRVQHLGCDVGQQHVKCFYFTWWGTPGVFSCEVEAMLLICKIQRGRA
jgi:hypothetical protein